MRGKCLALTATAALVAIVNAAAADPSRPQSPSIVYLGSAEAPATGSGPSIVALGEPGVENINVAAVGKKNRPGQLPMVIRGGVVGDAFTAPTAAAVALPDSKAKTAPGTPVAAAKPGAPMPPAAAGAPPMDPTKSGLPVAPGMAPNGPNGPMGAPGRPNGMPGPAGSR